MKIIKDLGMMYPNKNSKTKRHFAIYECPLCFKHFKTKIYNVKIKKTKSCGCLKPISTAKRAKTHGLSKTRIYRIYCKMKERCYNKNNVMYKNYGAKEIKIYEDWLDNFIKFYNWSINNGYNKNLVIDRIDNDGDYCPENCRWVDVCISAQNRRIPKNNKSGYKGVRLRKDGRWASIIGFKNQTYFLGYYSTAKEAAIKYNNFIINNKTNHVLNYIS